MPMNQQKLKRQYFAGTTIAATILIHLIGAALSVCADEKLPVLKVGPEVYSNVTVTAVTATDIYFSYDKGAANAKLKNLEPALQKHFKFDAAAAAAANAASTSVSGTSASAAAAG